MKILTKNIVGHREATSVSYNTSFEFFGVGTDGGVRPLQNHYALQPSCQDLELKCHFALKNTTVTNSTDILSGVDLSESESLLLPKEPLRKFPITHNFVSKCKNQDCESNRLLVFSFHSLRYLHFNFIKIYIYKLLSPTKNITY